MNHLELLEIDIVVEVLNYQVITHMLMILKKIKINILIIQEMPIKIYNIFQ
jgi:hypothetical protein